MSLIRFGGYDRNPKSGKNFTQFFIKKCSLRKTDTVLDIGSGLGLVAVPVLEYLNSSGRYEGLDIIKESVKWCNKNICRHFPNARFTHASINNASYNPKGKFLDSDFKLPYQKTIFDFVWLKSVFTHMRPDGVKNYICEISKVLKSEGKCLITYFLLDNQSRQLINNGKSRFNFIYEFDACLTTNPKIPEDAILYDLAEIKDIYIKHGLSITDIFYGNWCSRDNINQTITCQDIIIARKL